jgi:spore coat protein H
MIVTAHRQAIAYNLFAIMLFHFTPNAAVIEGIVRDETTSRGIQNVRVSVGHTDTIAYTDASGRFKIDTQGAAIGVRPSVNKEALTIRVDRNRIRLQFSRATGIRTIKVAMLSGKTVFSGSVGRGADNFNIRISASGIYFLSCYTGRGLVSTLKVPVCSDASRSVSLLSVSGPLRGLAATAQGYSLVFLHDNYYPKDTAVATGTVTVQLKPDPRAAVFIPSRIYRYDFTMTVADSLLMEKGAIDEEYVPATFTYNNTNFGTVGLRYKGSTYSLPNCFDTNGARYDKDVCKKISLKVKFDKYNDTLRFYSMKLLNLHSMSADGSKMHDMLAYGLFREMGIMASRCAYANVYINGVHQGLFIAVENVDGRMMKARWYEDPDGNLYKEVWPRTEESGYYLNGLQTNEKPEDSPDVSKMVAFAKAIAASDPATFKTNVGPYLDFDYWLHYIAVDRVIHNADGIMTWYNQPNWVNNHNYYFYQETAADGKFWIIPWDLHVTYAPTDPIFDDLRVPEWNVKPASCQPVTIWGGQSGIPPNCDKLTGLTASVFWNDFVKIGENMLKGPFAVDRVTARIDSLKSLIDAEVKKDAKINYPTWQANATSLRNTIRTLHTGFDDYLHGVAVVEDTTGYSDPFHVEWPLVVDTLSNFEMPEIFSFKNWTTANISANSTHGIAFDTVGALGGKTDVKITFAFNRAPGTTTYNEWLKYILGFYDVKNIARLKEIRLTMKADTTRYLWFGIGSPAYVRNNVTSSEYGWWGSVNSTPALYVYKIRDIDYPTWERGARPEILDSVLARAFGLVIQPNPRFTDDGDLAVEPDSGYLRIDNVRFLYE